MRSADHSIACGVFVSAEHPAATTSANPCALLASAARAADARELQALEREDFARSREWQAVAAEVRKAWDMALEAARPGRTT